MQKLHKADRQATKSSRTEGLRFAVSLCSLAGIVCIAIHVLFLYIFRNAADTFPGQYIYDMAVFAVSMLLPALVLGYMGNGVKTYFTQKGRKLPFLPSALLVVFGFSGCIFFNDIAGIFDLILPSAEAVTIYITPDFGSFMLILVSSAVFPAVCEEAFFRGYMYSTMSRYGAGFASFFTAVMFGMMHFSPSQMIFAFLCGFMFGYIRYVSGRFILTVIIHFLNNAFSTVSVFVRLTCGGSFHEYYILTHIMFMALLIFSAGLLIYGGFRLFRFRKPRFPLSVGDKLTVTVTTPAFLIFAVLSVMEKFT